MSKLLVWSSAGGQWVDCPRDEITWLDRSLLSGNQDLTLHRSPRCAGLRYVHHRWELFSRDPTHQVYLAPHTTAAPVDHRSVREAAQSVLPVAPAQHYETLPVVLEDGSWLVSVGNWVLPLRLEATARRDGEPGAGSGDEQPATRTEEVWADRAGTRRGSRPRKDAAQHVRGYFERNATARMAVAYLYQEFILGLPAPQPVPMLDVVVALDLTGEGAVSDYKKLLQGFIWEESGHQRELAEFLLSHGLLTRTDLTQAREVALANERSGRSELARQRLRYRPRKKPPEEPAG
ncbi:MAG TPA: hypothetical protein VGS62_08260 [Streptosporangiaceae bacterium]|nr:hypothetical protein [Streptosporangiaceae bacterium]